MCYIGYFNFSTCPTKILFGSLIPLSLTRLSAFVPNWRAILLSVSPATTLYNKIYHACEVGDVYTPLFASVEFTYELEMMLGHAGSSPELPDMVAAYDSSDLKKIADTARAHQAAFESLLQNKGIHPLAFSTFEEVQQFINEK